MKEIDLFWADYVNHTQNETPHYTSIFHFELTEKWANELLELVLIGQKKATCSSKASFEIDKEKIPEVGDVHIITDWDHHPRCVVRTTNVTLLPFNAVGFDLCSKEGEDDCLESWQRGHERFFREEGSIMGYEFHEAMIVVFEEFEVVYKT